jgi:spore coat protein U-like protein
MNQRNPFMIAVARYVSCAAMVAFLSQTSLAAASCKFTSVDPVSFGVYDIFSTQPNNNGVGSITIDCKGSGNDPFDVTLSTGQSHSYTTRTMTSGANHLDYNLYTGADRSAVWGDGHGHGNQLMTVRKDHATTLHVYGQIPAGQDAAVGTYTDSIVATVTF